MDRIDQNSRDGQSVEQSVYCTIHTIQFNTRNHRVKYSDHEANFHHSSGIDVYYYVPTCAVRGWQTIVIEAEVVRANTKLSLFYASPMLFKKNKR